jgi:hypothetical protein
MKYEIDPIDPSDVILDDKSQDEIRSLIADLFNKTLEVDLEIFHSCGEACGGQGKYDDELSNNEFFRELHRKRAFKKMRRNRGEG